MVTMTGFECVWNGRRSDRTIPSRSARRQTGSTPSLLDIVSLAVPAVFLFATLDTKGREAAFVRDLLASWDIPVTLVDVGALGSPAVAADVPRERIFELAGTTARRRCGRLPTGARR